VDLLSIWLIAGLILLITEMVTSGFFILFIAIGCFAAALTASLHGPLWVQTVVCAIVSVVGMLTLRKPIQKRLLKSLHIEADIGKEIRIDSPIGPHQQARITYQGSTWLATNVGADSLSQGDHVTIVGIDGNILLIRKVD
jgi:membrane protein implicated in regulation of membrane protease activity